MVSRLLRATERGVIALFRWLFVEESALAITEERRRIFIREEGGFSGFPL